MARLSLATNGMQEMQASEAASQFVEGLDYPISKDAIIAAAREASVGPTLEEALKKLPEREYSGPEDLTQALNAAA
ncbi:MAG: DUF2795 domain-containing protein [Chloroflexi bacterium]|nr:MAG: DUF2795 domain-containing protein [Chloroflexota bacterium]